MLTIPLEAFFAFIFPFGWKGVPSGAANSMCAAVMIVEVLCVACITSSTC